MKYSTYTISYEQVLDWKKIEDIYYEEIGKAIAKAVDEDIMQTLMTAYGNVLFEATTQMKYEDYERAMRVINHNF